MYTTRYLRLKELRLRGRYENYNLITFKFSGVRYRLLHNLYHMGNDWYEETYKKLRETIFSSRVMGHQP